MGNYFIKMADKGEILFPYASIREVQGDMIKEVVECIEKGEHAIIHAPTGIGKTVSVLSPALAIGLKKKLDIFFLTSRHTQHHLAISTLRDIKKKHGIDIISCDIIGKKWMCGLEDVKTLYNNEFNEYCESLKEKDSCEFYSNTRKKSGGA